MFTEIGIENFKAFSKMQRMPLKPITLLYGPNSSGKSSLIQSLLLFKQTLEESTNDEVPLLSRGNLVDLGDYSEFIHKHDDKHEFKMSFSFNFIWDPEVASICWESRPTREDEIITMEFTFSKDKAGDVIVKTIRLFYLRNPEPLLVYNNVASSPKLSRIFGQKSGDLDSFTKSFLFLESINFNSEFIKENWDCYAKNYGNNAKSDKEISQCFFSDDLNTMEKIPVWSHEEAKARKKILRHLEKIELSFYNNSFENFSQIGMPPNDRIIKIAKCFPYGLAGRAHYWRLMSSPGWIAYAGLFNRQEEYLQIVPVDFILPITNLLSQYLKKIIHIGPLREFPGRAYSFSGNAGSDVGKSGKYMPDILFKRPDIVENVNYWFGKFEMGYELNIERFKRNLFTLMRIPLISPLDSGGSRHPVPMQSAMGFRMIPPSLVGA